MIKKLIHNIKHYFGWNTGNIVSWKVDGIIYIGFQCDECNKIDKKSIVLYDFKEKEENDSIIETE